MKHILIIKDVWKRANLDAKETFSKIQCDRNYHPKKKTVMALCIALQLDRKTFDQVPERTGRLVKQ